MRTLLILIIGCMLASPNVVNAQKLSKASKKIVKTNTKQLTKEKWILDGTGTINGKLTSHYLALDSGTAVEFTGTANDKRSLNLGKAIARNNAINEYVETTRSMVRARINTDITDINDEQRENFAAGYERLVVKELDGDIKPSFYIYRRNSDGTYEVRGFFIVDETKAAAASKRALAAAAEEVGLAIEYADKVSGFVNDGINNLNK